MSIEFGLTLAMYGIAIVFGILLLLLCTIEVLKRAIRSETKDTTTEPEDISNALESVIISAAIAAYMSSEVETSTTRQSDEWRIMGRIEELDSRLIR